MRVIAGLFQFTIVVLFIYFAAIWLHLTPHSVWTWLVWLATSVWSWGKWIVYGIGALAAVSLVGWAAALFYEELWPDVVMWYKER